jgi:bifunctional DNase/RNase
MIEVQVERVGLIPDSGAMSVFLKDRQHGKFLIIQVGVFEGSAILQGMGKVSVPRPLSHDLMTNIIRDLGGEVQWLLIHDLVDNTYYGEIRLRKDGLDLNVDARPSDGIALCVRVGAPIYVEEKLSRHFVDEMELLMAIAAGDETVH